jgi:hypothetical protein
MFPNEKSEVQTGMTSKENNKCEDDPEYDYEV